VLDRQRRGDVAFLAADLVGNGGDVTGAESAPLAVSAARARAEARSLRNVSFRACDPTETAFERPFDAVVGRYVLMFNAHPAAMIGKLAGHLRPGGVMVFHEVTGTARARSAVADLRAMQSLDRRDVSILSTETRMGAMPRRSSPPGCRRP
jgi:2-polyprenyl-3-methyl-5-hydroxy-6-metoxy-1,4-benzoquinol methylase